MESDDELEFMKQINQPEVKQEEPDQEGEFKQANSKEASPDEAGSSEGPSGIADLLETLDAVTEKEDDEVEKWNHMLVEKEPKRRRNGGGGSRESKEDDRKQFEEPKAPLTTFGHSARPRRSVNYASIERGDEAQAQSLVTEFRSSTNKRQKRTRDELDENYVEESENGRPAGRKRKTGGGGQKNNTQYQPPGSQANSTLATGRALFENKTAIDEYMQFVPRPTDEQPAREARKFGTMLEQLPAIKRSSGGFRKFISKIGDKSVLDLAGIVQRRCVVEADDHMLLRSLRHIYNSMPMSYRRNFEYQARMDFHASRMFVPHLSMPLSEILVTDPNRPPPRMLRENEVRVNCCSLRPIVSDMCQVIEHYLQFHDIVHFFGCDFCLKVFSSRYDLTKHECKEFGDHMYDLICKQQTLSLSAAYMYLTCSQCGLWLSVKASVAGQKGWTYFATAVKNHSCKALIPILVYFRKGVPEEGKNVRMQFQIITSFDIGIPLSCAECGIEEFKSLKEIEDHFREKHGPKTCTKCQKQFGTEYTLRLHSLTHYSQSLQLANHLVNTATYHPPPASGRPPHVGFKSNIAAVGGFTANEIQAMETMEKSMNSEFVGPDENTIRKKVFRWKRKKSDKKENRENTGEFTLEPGESSGEEEFQKRLKEQEQEASSSDSEESPEVGSGNKNGKKLVKRARGDLGYEHIDRNAMFERSEAEKEARKRIEKMLGANVFMTRERLLEPEEALEILKHAETVKLPALVCPIADEIAAAAMKTITMPLTNCIDPLKDILLVNKIYVYCGKCNHVVNSDIATHSAKCDVPEDSLIEIYHGASGPHAGVHCIVPGCDAHLCSVIALRSHASTVHNLKMSIPSANDEVPDAFQQTRYDRSMMQLAKHFHGLQKDQRTHLARMTDIDCLLPFTGLLDSKIQPRHQQPPVLQRQEPASNPATQRQAPAIQLAPGRPQLAGSTFDPRLHVPMKIPEFRTPYFPNAPNPKLATRCKPFYLPRSTRWYKCSWCEKDYENLDVFVDHIVKYHVHVCSNCGKGYATSNTKRVHVCTNAIAENRPPGMTSSGTCPTCREIFPIDIVYTHMLRRHFSTIEFIQATGEMLPQIRDMTVRPIPVPSVQRNFPQSIRDVSSGSAPGTSANGSADPRLSQIAVGLAPVYGVDIQRLPPRDIPFNSIAICPADYRNVDMRLMCYICELTYDNINELTTHLDEHPERWAHCPLCEDPVPVDGHYELQKHFMTKHVVKISGALCCAHCQESHRFMSSHLIYRCKKISKCSICGQKSPDATANRVHMQRSHIQALRRFQCTYCPKVFTSVGEYYEHKCLNPHRHIYACECQPIKFFNTPSEYCDHFDSVHILRNHCKLCGIQAPTQEAMVRHRPSHMKTAPAREMQRKLHLLMKSLYPKDDSGYMRWVRGGDPPTSFINVDRTGKTYMMGRLGPVNMENIPPYRPHSPPRTLFDALEGPAARNRNAAGTSVGGGAPRVFPVKPKNPTSNNDVVMLSDDEDCVAFDPVTVDKNTNNVATSSSTSEIDRTVRVEQSSDGYGAVKAPGYIDEDDAELEVRKSPSGGEPVVKEVIDENGDDELAVVAEVENSAGTLPSNVSAGREKKFKCTKCSSSFYTNSSLKHHAEKDHKQDAGGTVCSLESYGIPKTTRAAYLCRNCSIVFEDQVKHMRHMQQHGETTLACADCCGIAFNHTALNNHLQAHRDKKVFFACGRCLVRFPNDLALMEHLKLTHETELFYFCKICALGSTNPDYVYQHISTHTGHHFTHAQRMGAVPVQLLNYEPANEKEFAMKVLQKAIQLHTPSDCTHRSMLVQCDTLVTCKTCHCFQQWFSYMAYNKHSEETGFPTFVNMEPYADQRKDFPLIRYLSDKNRASMLRFGNVKAIPGIPPHQPQQPQRFNNVLRPLAPQLENPNVTQRNPNIQANAPIGINGGAPVVSMTSNGARVIHPAQSNMAAQRPSPATQPTRRFVVNNRGNPATPPVAQTAPVIRNHIATSTKCKYSGCDKMLYSEFDRQLHTMHESETMWFCRQCGNSQKSEIDLFLHYVREHLTPAHAKQQVTGFKSNVFKLRCPLCTKLEFQSPKAFEKHIRTEHAAEFPFEASCCDARFAVKQLCDLHDKKHTEFLESNGTDAMCCPICGSLDMWSLPKDQTTECLQSHMIRHGLDYRSSCRCCLKQFPADIYQTLGIDHIREEHCFVNNESKQVVCKLCGQTGMTDEQFADHCRKSHLFNILVKSSHSTRGELVVSTGDEYDNYTGLKISKAAGRLRPSTSGAGGSVNVAAALGESSRPTNGEAEVYTID
ncbi:hypothetical protein GCK72_009070 [Caenorhabditis remanei]|uniref:C2H2-type domain-containing protein n=1 Tax=Caenorhabditis remanei TaxID=31234 RepID=A0A6A5GZ69_CAERE|nr:hypothetical protein GCK72_009070 [Caenorhabditis remanei]KAF1760820.1 hypothetical protein GCK72_009070 [Caenorhabditis remanei]